VPPPSSGGGANVVPNGIPWFYPWGYGGLGYYGWYDPGDPYGGGYSGGYGGSSSYGDEGSLRLKVKPSEASVYVDGYYVGLVDDFDGIFQRLHVASGTHHVEIEAPGYEPLEFDVMVEADRTVTYKGELQKIQ